MQMNIMVAGAGIGGLAVAAALRDAGHKVRVFERSPELRVAGTGITLAANAMKALQVLGLADKALLAGHVVRHADIRTSKGRVLAKLPMRRMEARVGLPSIGIQRTALLEILHEAAGPENVTTSARAAGYRNEDGGVVLLFADGTEARGDLLVGADGNRSAIRDRLREPSPLNYTGYTCWRGNADITPAQLGCDGFFEAWGRGARFGGVMVGPGEFTWYAAKNEPAGGADTPATIAARVRADFGDWAEPIPSILAATPAERMFRLDIADRTPDARWIDGRVALLGDAAHAITPNMGQGACQALEDAVVFADRLARAGSVEAGLRRYASDRRARAHAFVRGSRQIGRLTHLENPVARVVRNLGVRAMRHTVLPSVFDYAGLMTRISA